MTFIINALTAVIYRESHGIAVSPLLDLRHPLGKRLLALRSGVRRGLNRRDEFRLGKSIEQRLNEVLNGSILCDGLAGQSLVSVVFDDARRDSWQRLGFLQTIRYNADR